MFNGRWYCGDLCACDERRQMSDEKFDQFMERVLAWTYSMAFPLGIAALIYLQVHLHGDWSLYSNFGVILIAIGSFEFVCAIFFPSFLGFSYSAVLQKQAIYSGLWILLVGAWMRWQFLGFTGFVLVTATALPLCPLSHREVLRLDGK
jgi:hypothetical protein